MLNPIDTTKIEEIKPAFNNARAVGDTLLDLLELFTIKSLCLKNGMQKVKGYPVKEILVVLI